MLFSYSCECPDDGANYDITSCVPIPACSSNPCTGNATCVDFLYNNTFHCRCPFGFEGWFLISFNNEIVDRLIHRLTSKKGVHQFRLFLPTVRTPNSIVVCSCMYAFLLKWDPMCTPRCDGVRIGSHFHKDAYMNEQTTISIHKEIVPKLVYTIFCCKPVH